MTSSIKQTRNMLLFEQRQKVSNFSLLSGMARCDQDEAGSETSDSSDGEDYPTPIVHEIKNAVLLPSRK